MIKKLFLRTATLVLLNTCITPTYASDVAWNPNFYTALYDVVSTDRNILGTQWWGIRDFLQKITTGELGAQGISDMIVNLIVNALIPILAIVGIVLAILWFIKLMTATEEAELKTGWNYLIWWVVGTLVMVTAAWIVITFVGATGDGWILQEFVIWKGASPSGAEVASAIYRKIAYPLIRVILNIIIGIFFLMAAGQAFKYLFSGNDEAQKKALAILLFTAVGIIIVILAKTLVEVTYGQYEEVVTREALLVKPWGEDLWKVGDGVFENPQIGMLRTVINRVLGLATFVVTIIIVYIGYLMLVQPNNDETAGKLQKAITRALAGILVIGIAYLIANFVIIR